MTARAEPLQETAYDLVTDAADFPAWTGPPRRTLVICSHPRSGTTLLGEALHRAGGLGLPLEYFHRGFRPHFERRWEAADLKAYVRAVHHHRTDPSGVLSVKLFWQDVEELAHEIDPAGQPAFGQTPPESQAADAYRRQAALIADIFPNPTWVYLRRRDRVRQAVSALVAGQTGVWRSVSGQAAGPAAEPAYDFDRLSVLMGLGDYCHRHWQAFFAALGLRPYELTYEALTGAYETTVRALLRAVGADRVEVPPPRLHRQSNALTEAIALRFLKDEARRRPASPPD
jgi:LPS sulfotransferase NodH